MPFASSSQDSHTPPPVGHGQNAKEGRQRSPHLACEFACTGPARKEYRPRTHGGGMGSAHSEFALQKQQRSHALSLYIRRGAC
jgi:hypothetical protein